jgi:HD-like signal output (HDOD) protein
MNAVEYANQVTDLFVLPDSCVRIKKLIDDNKSSVDELAEVINVDPVLTAIILRLANSAFYNFPREVTSIAKAIQIIGSRGVYNLVIGYGTKYAFKDLDNCSISLEQFWESSIRTALIAKQLAKAKRMRNTEALFVCGLLLNIGELVVAQVNPAKAEKYADSINSDLPWVKQAELFGFTFNKVSTELLKGWQLPYEIISPIDNIYSITAEDDNQSTQILHLAMCQSLGHDRDHPQEAINSKALMTALDLSPSDIQDATEYALVEGMSILAMLNPSATSIY